MNEVLDIIYSHEGGQITTTIPLVHLTNMFLSKQEMERQLLMFFEVLKGSKSFSQGNRKPNGIGDLVKISTCIYSKKMDTPHWYGEWDGKFYYNQEALAS